MSDNDNMVFITKETDPKTGLTGLYLPHVFHAEANELGIIGKEPILRFSCAWYFCRLAHQAIDEMTQQIVYEEDEDATGKLRQIFDSVCSLYGAPEINEVMRYMSECRKLAFRRKLLWNGRLQAWLDSAGKAYNEVTREEKATNKED